MATTTDLSPAQNERLRKAMLSVRREMFWDKSQPMAAAMGLSQPTVSEFLRGKNGASLDTARRFAALCHRDVNDILGPDERAPVDILVKRPAIQTEAPPEPILPHGRSGPRPRRHYRDLPGYIDALREAHSRRMHWTPVVWELVAQTRAPSGMVQPTVEDLLEQGEVYAKQEAALESKGYLLPQSRTAKPPYKRHMSDVRNILGVQHHRAAKSR